MKKNAKTLRKAAEHCSQFHINETKNPSAKNSTSAESPTNVSCKNCEHYEPSNVCSLNLYQEILENHQF